MNSIEKRSRCLSMNWIISDVLGRVPMRKSRCSPEQFVGVSQLLILTAQLGNFSDLVFWSVLVSATITASLLRPLPRRVPRHAQLWRDCLARLLHRKVLGQDTILYQADHTVLRFLVKLLWHVLDFPIYSDGTKPGTVHTAT